MKALIIATLFVALTGCGGGEDLEQFPGPPDCRNYPELCI